MTEKIALRARRQHSTKRVLKPNEVWGATTEKWSHERAKIGMQIRGKNNLSKQCQGKENISDSECLLSLLSESSNRTFSNSHNYSGPS
ncbi:hypothetical protein CR513_49970, partial [Mucuna pruriens]